MFLNRMKSKIALFIPAVILSGLFLCPFSVMAELSELPASSPYAYEEVRQNYETRVAQQVRTLLEKVVGSDLVSVSVRADLDFNQNIVDNEVIDSDMPVIASSKTDGTAEETVYAFSKKTTRQIQNGGIVRNVSVAVLVDSSVPQTLLPRLQTLTQTAVGFDATRGDKIEFLTASFKEQPNRFRINDSLPRALEFSFLILVVVWAIVFVLYKSFRPKTVATPVMPDFAQPDKIEKILASSSQEKPVVSILKQVHDKIDQNPKEAVTVIRSWLYQGGEEVSGG